MANSLISILWLFFSSCSVVKQVALNRVHIASEASQYLLADLPDWANFSAQAGCRRKSNVKYLHFGHLHRSFSWDQAKLVQLQLLFNHKYRKAFLELGEKAPTPQMEERIFFETKGEVDSGIVPFAPIQSAKAHLVWIDPAQSDAKYRKALEKLLKTGDFYHGHPIFVSHCLDQQEVEHFVRSLTQEDADFRFISAEMFSPFHSDWVLSSEFQISIDSLLKGKKIIFYRIGKWRPPGIVGHHQTKLIKMHGP